MTDLHVDQPLPVAGYLAPRAPQSTADRATVPAPSFGDHLNRAGTPASPAESAHADAPESRAANDSDREPSQGAAIRTTDKPEDEATTHGNEDQQADTVDESAQGEDLATSESKPPPKQVEQDARVEDRITAEAAVAAKLAAGVDEQPVSLVANHMDGDAPRTVADSEPSGAEEPDEQPVEDSPKRSQVRRHQVTQGRGIAGPSEAKPENNAARRGATAGVAADGAGSTLSTVVDSVAAETHATVDDVQRKPAIELDVSLTEESESSSSGNADQAASEIGAAPLPGGRRSAAQKNGPHRHREFPAPPSAAPEAEAQPAHSPGVAISQQRSRAEVRESDNAEPPATQSRARNATADSTQTPAGATVAPIAAPETTAAPESEGSKLPDGTSKLSGESAPAGESRGFRRFGPLLGRQTSQAQGERDGPSAIERARFVQRVARAFESLGERGGPLRLRLSPPQLGSLRLEVTVHQGVVAARIEAETPAARVMLLDNLPALRERLAGQDIKIERFDVDLMDQSPDGLPQTPQEDRRAAHQQRRAAANLRRSTEAPPDQEHGRAGPRPASGDGQLNVVV